MSFFEHLMYYMKQGAHILAGCMFFRGLASDVCNRNKILNSGHCPCVKKKPQYLCVAMLFSYNCIVKDHVLTIKN